MSGREHLRVKRTGAAALVEALEAAGTEVLFGYPGSTVLEIFDHLTRARFPFVLARHEQGALHMADGYARATGRSGVAIVTSGPGVTNAVTGLATANMDGIPLVVITGQVPLDQIGTDAFQEADTSGITRAVSKHNFLVQRADEIPEIVAQAFYIATHGKPGPVVIDVPRNCQEEETAARRPERLSFRAYHPEFSASAQDIATLARLVNTSRRPVLYCGGGVIAAAAADDVAALAHRADIPVATTLMGLGAFDSTDSLSLGMAGMHGAWCANCAIAGCDLLIALGVRFSDRVTARLEEYAPKAKIVQVDCDPASVGKNVSVDLGIIADVKDVLRTVASRVREARHADWQARIAKWRAEHPLTYASAAAGVIAPQEAISCVTRLAGDAAIIVTDVGQHQMWCAQYGAPRHPRHFLTSGGMGTMGFGIPAALGAAFAHPDRRVVAVCGDGGAQMTFEEVVVAVEHELDVKIVIINNGALGMVRQSQAFFYQGNYSATILTTEGRTPNEQIRRKSATYWPDFVRLATASGARGLRIVEPARLMPDLKRAFAWKGPVVIEIQVDPSANVLPMIPPGRPITETIHG